VLRQRLWHKVNHEIITRVPRKAKDLNERNGSGEMPTPGLKDLYSP
jgi:hypothetical protein